AARSCVAGLAAPGGSRSAWIALSRRSLWPKGMPSFSRSAAERSPSTSASMWLARKAASYCERSRLLSHAPMSTAAPLRAVLAVAAARILGIVSQQLRREVSQKHDQDRMGDFRRDAIAGLRSQESGRRQQLGPPAAEQLWTLARGLRAWTFRNTKRPFAPTTSMPKC